MPELEHYIMAKAMPKETSSVLGGLQIKTPGASGLEMAMELLQEPASYSVSDATQAHLVTISEDQAFQEFEEQDKIKEIVDLLNDLSPTERQVLYMKYYCGMKNADIGAKFGRSRDYALRIHEAALTKIRNNPDYEYLRDYLD